MTAEATCVSCMSVRERACMQWANSMMAWGGGLTYWLDSVGLSSVASGVHLSLELHSPPRQHLWVDPAAFTLLLSNSAGAVLSHLY